MGWPKLMTQRIDEATKKLNYPQPHSAAMPKAIRPAYVAKTKRLQGRITALTTKYYVRGGLSEGCPTAGRTLRNNHPAGPDMA
jgi:hypothetical protein